MVGKAKLMFCNQKTQFSFLHRVSCFGAVCRDHTDSEEDALMTKMFLAKSHSRWPPIVQDFEENLIIDKLPHMRTNYSRSLLKDAKSLTG